MDKGQLIHDIRGYNPTAKPRFLAQFNEAALLSYLEHLREVLDEPGKAAAGTRKPAKWKRGQSRLTREFAPAD